MTEPLLKISNLKTAFFTGEGIKTAVDGVDLTVGNAETIGIVGESGSGKSVTAFSILQLVPYPGRIVEGEILFKGKNLLDKDASQMRSVRGNQISMIFQEPMTSLNPVLTVGRQVMEPLIYHRKLSRKAARREAIDLLKLVGIPSSEQRIDEYPHQLSGGMRQRAMIAIALACRPDLLIADEPTTALDVTIQAQILALMSRLQQELGMAIILITHDLGVVAQLVDKVAVMYAGQIVESGSVVDLFDDPWHPYTMGLLESVPRIHQLKERLQVIDGTVPSPNHWPSGCRFHPRCSVATSRCATEMPPLSKRENNRFIRCWRRETPEEVTSCDRSAVINS